MALSGTIDLNLTADELIERALGKIGVRGQGFSVSADEQAEAIDTLNEMLKTWSTDGPNLWAYNEQSVTLVTGTQTYTLSPRPRVVQNVRFLIDGVEQIPMTPWDQQDWDRFIYKTSTGNPLKYLVRKLRTSTTLTLWPIPTFSSGAQTLLVGYDRALEIVTDGSQDIDIPEEFMECAVMCLAARLIEDYQLPEDANTQRIVQRAQLLYQQAMASDRTGEVRLYLT